MKKLILTAIAALLFTSVLEAQVIVRGKVLDANDEALEFATVALYTLPDSTLIVGSVTDSEGSFSLEGEGDLLRISMIGYKTADISVSSFVNGSAVKLLDDTKMLEGAVVSAVLPKTELKGNAVVTNIAGSVLEHTGNALDVLEKIPGMISMNGNLEVIGRGAPLYYINGRKITDNSELRNLMSEDIKSIDVISNPGAAYGGEVRCVVRIRTVKHQGDGLSFALTSQARQHIYDCRDFEPSWSVLDLNYRKNGWDVFGKLVYWNQRGYQISDISGGTYVKKDNNVIFNIQEGSLDYRGHHGGVQSVVGANWQINENHSLGFKIERDDNTIDESHMVMDVDVNINNTPFDHVVSVNDMHGTGNSQWSGNLYYDGNVDKLNVNFNADFIKGQNGSATDVAEEGSSAVTLESGTERENSLLAGKLVLSYPVWKGMLQAGAEETYVATGQTYFITLDDIPASDSEMVESTIAGFAEYSAALPFGQFSAGLRFEHAGFDYDDNLDASKSVRRVYDNWFPSLNFSTILGKAVGVNLSYSGKTIRPNYSTLSSEIMYDNKFTYQQGDPLLKNEVQRTLSLNANWKFLTFSGNFETVENSFYQKAYPFNDEGVVMIKYANADDPVRKLSFYLNASPSVGIWYPRLTVGLEKQFFTTTIIDPRVESGKREVTLNKPMYLLQLNNAFRFKKGWTLDADYQYVSPFNELIMLIEKPVQSASVALSKSFLANDALNLRLEWNDIFNTNVYYFFCDYGNCVNRQSNDSYSPCIQLRLSYRFNSAQNKYKGTGAGASAKSRM